MIYIIIFFFVLISNNPLAQDYVFEVSGRNERKTVNINENISYSILTTESQWTDNLGDYGDQFCYGHIKNINQNVDVEVYCENTNQIGEKFTTVRKRQSIKGTGGGVATYLGGTGKYLKLIGLKCAYGVQHIENSSWYTHKCTLPNDFVI